MSGKILVLCASTHGHAGRIASGIGLALERAGVKADVRCIGEDADVSPWKYDAVVIGASIHGGRHQRKVVEWVRRHAAALSQLPGAFFSVSLTAAEDSDEARATTRRLIDEFVEETGWTPGLARSFAGALQYREYRLFTRYTMRLMMGRGGHPSETRRDYDYTDWDSVERFGTECAALVSREERALR